MNRLLRSRLAPELERELEHVHRLELARLLREAVEMRLEASEALDVPSVTGRGLRLFGDHRVRALSAWRRAADEVLALAALDRVECDSATVIARWVARDPADWPTAESLATDSLLLEDCEEGRLVLGRAQIAARRPLQAVTTLVEACRRGVSSCNRWRVLAALASANEQSGAEGLAFEALGLALREQACAIGPRCAALALALLHGREDFARRAADSLETLVARVIPLAVRRELRGFLVARGEPQPFDPDSPSLRALFREWSRQRSLLGSACRAFGRVDEPA